MTKHPEPSKIREMCDLIEVANKKYHPDIDMNYIAVSKTECGTVCCHAGLFELALESKKTGDYAWYQDSIYPNKYSLYSKDDRVDYIGASKLIAKYLGFNSAGELTDWALTHRQLWGNSRGSLMFQDAYAFGTSNNTITVQRIIDHWRAVAGRIEKIQLYNCLILCYNTRQ